MAVSTNSVIHYTERIENLKGIIHSQGFRFKYCLEEIDINATVPLNSAFPMCSFCDIPLSEVKKHINSYGSYGIGLSKSWAKKSGLNPVLYIEKNSKLSNMLQEQGFRIRKMFDEDKLDQNLLFEFFTILGYCKNYEGPLNKGRIKSDSYRFYDEREWRYIPPEPEIKEEPSWIPGDKYIKDKESFNDKIKDCYLKFIHSDISYLIVYTEEEIPDLLNTLNEVFEDKITSKELKVLSTKIMTINQIENDF